MEREGGRVEVLNSVSSLPSPTKTRPDMIHSSLHSLRRIPSHFDVVSATSRDWKSAFEVWTQESPSWTYPKDDIKCLLQVRDFLLRIGVIFDKTTRPNRSTTL
mmetsp:Transcript_1231/g.3587  ORF Transcript_1231/g.3587 Transcript_1231/m.3587 type:complete len:103 (+) Transcript_1231:1176-1484(+)